MTASTTLTIRVTQEVKEKLDALARSTKRSKSFLAAEALASYIETNAWQMELIASRVKEADAGGPFVDHERVAAWLDSLGTGRRLPRPRAQRRRSSKASA